MSLERHKRERKHAQRERERERPWLTCLSKQVTCMILKDTLTTAQLLY